MNKIDKIYLSIYIFLFLFAPPFISGINISIILAAYSALVIFIKYLKRFTKLFKQKELFTLFSLIMLYICIYFISYSLNSILSNNNIFDNYIINMYSIFLNFFVTFICAIYLIFKIEDYKLSKNDLIKLFIIAFIIQLIIAIITILFPAAKTWTLDHMLKDNNSDLLKSPWLTERRFYGFSNNLLDLFGFGVGICAIIPLFCSIENKKIILLSPLILILSALNSRSGFVVFSLGLIIYYYYLLKYKKISINNAIIYSLLIIFVLFGAYNLIKNYSPHTLEWIKNDFLSFINSDSIEGGTASAILNKNFWTIPNDYRIIFGSGFGVSAYSKFRIDDIIYSDCGYINEIWKAGFIGLFIYLFINYYIISRCIKYESKIEYKHMYKAFFFCILVFLIKASLLGYNPGNCIIYTMFIYYINEKRKGLSK